MSKKLERIKALLEQRPDDPFVLYSLAMEERKSDRAAALGTFARLVEVHPDYLPTYYQYGTTLAEASETERARAILGTGLELATKTGDTHTQSELNEALAAL